VRPGAARSAAVTSLRLRDFRSYERAEVELGSGLTIVCGRNGAGKTNLLEGLYFGCVGRSCRTANEREVVRFGAPLTRVEVRTRDEHGDAHSLSVGFEPGAGKKVRVDGVAVERLVDFPARPLVGVFLPDRLELVKGAPALRRAHLDQVVAALWPARAATRREYARALAQRNALLGRVRAGVASRASLPAWDGELARLGVALMVDRGAAVAALADRYAARARDLGLDGDVAVRYRPRSQAAEADQLAAELADRVDDDLERGFTGHGPHRDELVLEHDGRELRAYGSQGQQRLALLALLLAEREAVGEARAALPLMLLDDVMSELDSGRRTRLVELLRRGGQSVITTTDLAHVPSSEEADVTRVAVAPGTVLRNALRTAPAPPASASQDGERAESGRA
jgi:DNA replication and repair protein RecF